MPRLTNAQYLQQRKRLRDNWFEFRGYAFGKLEGNGQMELHEYFAPTEPFTDEEALAHRAEMTKRFPSLAQKAGRAYQRALPFLDGPEPRPPITHQPGRLKNRRAGSGHVVVTAVRRPHPDTNKLKRIILGMMQDDLKRQKAERDKAA